MSDSKNTWGSRTAGKTIKAFCSDNGLSQVEYANKAGVAQDMLSRFISGSAVQIPNADKILKPAGFTRDDFRNMNGGAKAKRKKTRAKKKAYPKRKKSTPTVKARKSEPKNETRDLDNTGEQLHVMERVALDLAKIIARDSATASMLVKTMREARMEI